MFEEQDWSKMKLTPFDPIIVHPSLSLKKRDPFHETFPSDLIENIEQMVESMRFILSKSLEFNQQGGVLIIGEEASYYFQSLVHDLQKIFSTELITQITQRSGFTLDNFIGHVVRWWLTLPHKFYFIWVLSKCMSHHQIYLSASWNKGKQVSLSNTSPSWIPLTLCTTLSLAIGYFDPWMPWALYGLLGIGLGWRWTTHKRWSRWMCGGGYCEMTFPLVPLPSSCPQCGADLILRNTHHRD